MENTTVQTSRGDVTVKKLVLDDYAELLKKLQNLPAEFGKIIEGTDADGSGANKSVYSAVPQLVTAALPEFKEIMTVLTDADAERVGQMDLADVIELILASLELNDYERIVNSLKKIMALTRGRKSQATQVPIAADNHSI